MRERDAGFVVRDRNGSAWFLRPRRALSRSRCQEGPAGCPERGRALGGLPCAVERGLAQAGGGAEERGRTQALGRDRHLQDAGSASALQSLRRPDRVSGPRPALVHALPGPGPRGSGPRRYDCLAVSREARASGAVVEALFDAFDAHLKSRGYLAMGGPIVDASIVSAPVQRNSRAENTAIKDGDPPVAWTPNKRAQKDVDARWTKKHGKSYFGYKNPVNIDRKHKLMRRYTVTDAAVHDSQKLEALLDPHNPASDVWADTAYRSKETEEKLAEKGLRSRIHRRASRGKPLSQRAQKANRTRSKVRSRVEHVFGHQHTSMGGKIVRTIGLVRAKAKIGLMNLVYNISRLAFLERTATPA